MTGVVVLAAGGTGGHLFPAAALGGELKVRGWAVVLITDRRGAESAGQTFFADVTTYTVRSATPAGRNLFAVAWVLIQIVIGTWQAWWLLSRLRPEAVVGFGGYPSLPTMLAALQRGIPTLIHEQNAVLGRVNRILARRVASIALTYAETTGVPVTKRERAVVTGNPIRPSILAHRESDYPSKEPTGRFRLLVIGGSQGAAVFSRVVPEALAGLPLHLRERLEVSQQCRAEDLDHVDGVYETHGIRHVIKSFFDDVSERLALAHLVISRAGASSLGELACIGRPAILVPLPHAADDHQTANAAEFQKDGGAIVLTQPDDFTAEGLRETLEELMASPERLADMAAKAHDQARLDCDVALADAVEKIAGERSLSREVA